MGLRFAASATWFGRPETPVAPQGRADGHLIRTQRVSERVDHQISVSHDASQGSALRDANRADVGIAPQLQSPLHALGRLLHDPRS